MENTERDFKIMNFNEKLKAVLVELAVNDELPLDMTTLDSSVFDSCTTPLVDALITLQEDARGQIRVYGVDLGVLPDEHNIWRSDEDFINEAEIQGLIWSLKGFELQANNDQINFDNIFIKII